MAAIKEAIAHFGQDITSYEQEVTTSCDKKIAERLQEMSDHLKQEINALQTSKARSSFFIGVAIGIVGVVALLVWIFK